MIAMRLSAETHLLGSQIPGKLCHGTEVECFDRTK